MGNEKRLPVGVCTVKRCRRLFSKPRLPFFVVNQDVLTICVVMIPEKYQTWRKEKLLHLLTDTQKFILQQNPDLEQGDNHIFLHPRIESLLQMEKEEFSLATLVLTDQILNKLWSRQRNTFESIVLLLGKEVFPDIQMRCFVKMMQPFFTQINHLYIVYEAEEEELERWRETLGEYVEAFSYEYGLMTQITGRADMRKNILYRGNDKSVLFLDYSTSKELPFRWMRAGDIYLDVNVYEKKEMLLLRKCAEVFYLSPLKYLDTAVKSGYDKLVHLCK